MDIDRKKRFKIFIVDDVPGNIQLAANILKKSDYDFYYAENGKKALSLVKENDFDLILLDIMMPEMDGYEVCKHLKNNPDTRDIPIIFLTAKADTESIVKGLEAGAVDYVTKPFNDAELIARVKTHLELRRTQQDLREANVTKDKFFSIIAHDLKNPFNALIGLSSLLIKDYDYFDDEKKKKYIKNIYASSENIYNLLENLLNWSRMQTGRIEWSPEKLNLKNLVDENISLLKAAAENKNINFFSDLVAGSTVYADADMVTMVLRNLITNAIKFTPEGGDVRILSNSDGNYEEITVSDTGIGICEEDIKKLFRIDVPHSTYGTAKEKGTGLGLILCKEFIEKNGGKIWVESKLREGSKFKFTLPKAKNVFVDKEKISNSEKINDDIKKIDFPLRVLFVDDDDANHMITQLYLQDTPIQLDTAEHGAVAVEKFKSGHYDLVFMDMQMPVMDGFLAAREIRLFERKNGRKETPVIALSAYSMEEEIQESIDAGCNDHLKKPIMQADLINMISKYGKPDKSKGLTTDTTQTE